MGFFRSGEAPKPPEPKGMMQIFKNPAEQLTNSVASRIANYGTAVTVSFVSRYGEFCWYVSSESQTRHVSVWTWGGGPREDSSKPRCFWRIFTL